MATIISKIKCFICEKKTRTFICQGCLQHFCRIDLPKHLQFFNEQLDSIENNHDYLRQKFNDQKNHLKVCPLLEQINKWEKDSIEEIKQTANTCRETLINYKNKYIIEVENKLNLLTKQLKEIREENDFNEIDLNELRNNLTKLEEEFDKSLNILINQKSTLFINKISIIIPFKKDMKWKQIGQTIAGGNGRGNQLNQFDRLHGICLDDDDDETIYIADSHNHRIVEWKLNVNNGRIVAGGHQQGNQMNQLNYPTDVIINKENNSLIISDHGNNRVMCWSRQNNTENGQIIISDIYCSGLAMDKDGSLYVCNRVDNEVRRWGKDEKNGTIVAGGNGKGDHLNQFNHPTFILVDENYSLYVSDQENHRVMKWLKDAKEGIIVAGGNGCGNSLTQLSSPHKVIIDQLGQIYVSDYGNHRVVRWCEGEKEGSIVVGGNSREGESNQFDGPTGLSFDVQGNLYVADLGNDRIQKFEID